MVNVPSAQNTHAIDETGIGVLANCEISAVSYQGLTVTTVSGEPATLAIIDKNGNIIQAGPDVAREAWKVSVASYRNFLKGAGYLRVHTKPPTFDTPKA